MIIDNNKYMAAMNQTLKNGNESTFSAGYRFWCQNLFERAMRLIVWDGPDSNGVPQKQIEKPVLLGGTCFVTNKTPDKKIVSFPGWQCGEPTYYYDEYNEYSVHSPIFSDILKKDIDGIMIPNNSTFTSLYPLIHRYAIMLAHVEVTFVATLVDVRDNGGIPMASTEAARQSYKNYINNKAQGKFGAVVDPAFSTLKFIDTSRTSSTSLKDYVEIRKNLLHDFYEDIGVKTSWSKKGNMIEAEVQANDAMLLINLNDMVDSRKRAAEKINKMFGLNWSVDIAEELKYNDVDNVTDNNDKEDEDNETENSSND